MVEIGVRVGGTSGVCRPAPRRTRGLQTDGFRGGTDSPADPSRVTEGDPRVGRERRLIKTQRRPEKQKDPSPPPPRTHQWRDTCSDPSPPGTTLHLNPGSPWGPSRLPGLEEIPRGPRADGGRWGQSRTRPETRHVDFSQRPTNKPLVEEFTGHNGPVRVPRFTCRFRCGW